ncbi:MAG: MCP four helix bundle domain-containing protein [Maribacter sp.]
MFAKLTIPQRIQIGLVLAMAFLLVLGSNRLDQRHFSTIQTTVNSVHKDRVVVQDIIYKLNNIFHAKELRFILKESLENSASENQKVEELLSDFETTELTTNESKLLYKLKVQFSNLRELENKMSTSNPETLAKNSLVAIATLRQIEEKLDGLSQIQLQQSGQLTQLSKKSLGINILLSKLEVAFMVVIGIAILALVFYPNTTIKPTGS